MNRHPEGTPSDDVAGTRRSGIRPTSATPARCHGNARLRLDSVFYRKRSGSFDLTLCAFKIAEDPQVLFPVLVNLDGFFVSHVVEPLYLLEKEELVGFIPPFKYPFPLNPKKPVTMGAFAPPVLYSEAKKAQEEALRSTKDVILRVWKEFGERFGRSYNPIETYRTEDADTLLLGIGCFTETATVAIDELREKGEKVGLVRLPDTAKEKPQQGTVVAAGPGRVTDDGKRQPMEVKVGDTILFDKYSGSKIGIDEEDYLIIREEDILGILEK